MLVGQDQYNVPMDVPLELRIVLYRMNARLKKLNISRVTTNHAELMLLADASWWDSWHFGARPENAWHDELGWHNAGFLDGHAKFTHFRQRIYRTSDYTLIPFRDLAEEAATLQP